MVVGARQSFHFFRQNAWFLEKNRALSKFLYGILHYLISITKLHWLSIKPNVRLTARAILKILSYEKLATTLKFVLTRFYDVTICNPVFELSFLTSF